MKRAVLMLLFGSALLWGATLKNWQIYTNTDHIFNGVVAQDSLFFSTWGGLLEFQPTTGEFPRTYTPVDGLAELRTVCLDYVPDTRTLLVGGRSTGVTRITDGVMQIPLSENLGLVSDNVKAITHYDSLIFVGTDQGVTVFSELEGFPFPMVKLNLTTAGGLAANSVLSLAMMGDYLLCGTTGGLSVARVDSLMNTNGWHRYTQTNSVLPSSTITSISVKGTRLAIGTPAGLVVGEALNPASWTVYTQAGGDLKSPEVYSVLQTSDATWFAYGHWDESHYTLVDTTDVCVSRLDSDGSIVEYGLASGFSTNLVTSILEFEEQVYATSWGGGVFRLHSESWTPFRPNCPTSNVFTTLAVDQEGVLWTGDGNHDSAPSSLSTTGVSSFDGLQWDTYTQENSALRSENIMHIGVDQQNRKWFSAMNTSTAAHWRSGVSIYDDQAGTWTYMTSNNGLSNSVVSFSIPAPDGSMWVGTYGPTDGRINVVDSDLNVQHTFIFPQTVYYDPDNVLFGDNLLFISGYLSGLRVFVGDGTPESSLDSEWGDIGIPNDLNGVGGRPNGIAMATRMGWYGREYWFACERGLFKYDGSKWYRMSVSYKRESYDFSSNSWIDQERYYSDEQRLYGSAVTTPSAILIDPFDRVWIATRDNGITLYDPSTDRYTCYNKDNYPLVSNTIYALAYDPLTGNLFIGTDLGLNSVEIGRTEKRVKTLNEPVAYPNPFHPGATVGGNTATKLSIDNGRAESMPVGTYHCRIYNLAGELVMTLDENLFGQFSWDGRNKAGKDCSSGIYFFVVYGEGEAKSGKFALIR